MHRSYNLSRKHYASTWQVRDVNDRHDRGKVNKVAYELATTKDEVRREKLQMWLLECFHGYLLKYMNMIIFGQLPALSSPQGKDAQSFLKLLLNKKEENPSFISLRDSCKSLHLAFKEQATTDEVYDVLVLLFLKVCAHYDPLYPKKTEKVCKHIESQPEDSVLSSADIAAAVGFDPSGCIRLLVKRGVIASVSGPKKSTLGYRRGPKWPAPSKLFQITSMGFTGFAQRFFRWYLRNYIAEQMGTIESSGHLLQLTNMPTGGEHHSEFAVPDSNGAWIDTDGKRWAADTSLLELWKTLDVSPINESWVQHTDDFLFRNLTKDERFLLYLVFVKEYSWAEIAESLGKDSEVLARNFKDLIGYLESRSKLRSTLPKAA